MQLPLQITFRHMETSEAVEADIREKAEKLNQVFDHIMSCRVVVEQSHKSHIQGNIFHVTIDITVPGKELVVSREPEADHAHEDIYVVLRDAFDSMWRQLEAYGQQLRHEVKSHEVPPHGRISLLIPYENYGRIDTADGRDIYFHRNSVVNADFDKLEIGNEVRFDESQGDAGPQASSVHLIGKHHIVG